MSDHELTSTASRVAQGLDKRLSENALEMLSALIEAREALHRAQRFGRTLSIEPSLEWITDQLDQSAKDLNDFAKSVQESLDYLIR